MKILSMMKRYLLIFFFIALSFPQVVCAQIEGEGAPIDYPKLTLDISKSSVESSCQFNRILPNPNAKNLFIFYDDQKLSDGRRLLESSSISLVNLEEIGKEKISFLKDYRSKWNIDSINFSENGEYVFVRMGFVALKLNINSESDREIIVLDPSWAKVRVRPLKYGSFSLFHSESAKRELRTITSKDPLRISASFGEEVYFSFTPRDGSFWHRPFGNAPTQGGLLMSVYDPLNYHDKKSSNAGNKVAILGDQLDDQFPASDFVGYSRPIIDLTTGKIIGKYGIDTIYLSDKSEGKLRSVYHAEAESSIIDAVYNGMYVFALVKRNGELKIARIGDGVKEAVLCDFAKYVRSMGFPTPPGQINIEYRRNMVKLPSKHGLKSFSYLYEPIPSKTNGKLVIYFHGGPQASPSFEAPREVRKLIPAGYSVLAVEYASSMGSGFSLSDALKYDGISPIEKNMDDLASWLKGSNFKDISIIGYSFGAVPSLVLESRHPEMIQNVFFFAPLIVWDSANITNNEINNSREGNLALQSAADLAIFGGSKKLSQFNNATWRLWKGNKCPQKMNFFFGDLDEISKPSQLPKHVQLNSSIIIQEKTQHGALGAAGTKGDELWDFVFKKLDAIESADRGC